MDLISGGKKRVVVEFQPDGSVKLEVPPGLDYGQLVIAGSLLTRRAYNLLDVAEAGMRVQAMEHAAVAADLARERRT